MTRQSLTKLQNLGLSNGKYSNTFVDTKFEIDRVSFEDEGGSEYWIGRPISKDREDLLKQLL